MNACLAMEAWKDALHAVCTAKFVKCYPSSKLLFTKSNLRPCFRYSKDGSMMREAKTLQLIVARLVSKTDRTRLSADL